MFNQKSFTTLSPFPHDKGPKPIWRMTDTRVELKFKGALGGPTGLGSRGYKNGLFAGNMQLKTLAHPDTFFDWQDPQRGKA
jgi:hypothetical protein